MNADVYDKYPRWQDRAKAALDESQRPKPAARPKPPTRAELIEAMRAEIRELTRTAPGIRGRLLVLIDQIESAKK